MSKLLRIPEKVEFRFRLEGGELITVHWECKRTGFNVAVFYSYSNDCCEFWYNGLGPDFTIDSLYYIRLASLAIGKEV